MTDPRANVPVLIDGRYYPNLKGALRELGVLGQTTSARRTEMRQFLKTGRVVRVDEWGMTIVPQSIVCKC